MCSTCGTAIGTGKFLASARPVLTALVAVLVFSFILIPQRSEGGIYAPTPPPALIPETPGPGANIITKQSVDSPLLNPELDVKNRGSKSDKLECCKTAQLSKTTGGTQMRSGKDHRGQGYSAPGRRQIRR